MKLIKNARTYVAHLPSVSNLNRHLQEAAFTPIGSQAMSTQGWAPHPVTQQWVAPFHGGFCLTLRYDYKLLPADVIKKELAARIAEVQKQEGRPVGRRERAELKDEVTFTLLPRAFTKTKLIHAYYDPETHILVVPETSAKWADALISALIHSCGSVKTETVHVSAMSDGLTARLRQVVAEEFREHLPPAFAPFQIGDYAQLKQDGNRKITWDVSNLDDVAGGIREALDTGAQVERLELFTNAESGLSVVFKLTKDFVIQSIGFEDSESDDLEFDNPEDHWEHEASVQFLQVRGVIEELIDLFGYTPKEAPEDDDGGLI